ncbi:hypothetical protein [Isoptericola sp. AK164]|uniref:hypothetical protein n=1 Tax=Isoptericola sp. AK164 TaxID=3024246 RepID=UPI0024188E6F|nr:hypothetical protein [Isoptericola sp. AK164]
MSRRLESTEWERVVRGVYDVGVPEPASLSERLDQRRRRSALVGPLSQPSGMAVGLGAIVLQGVRGTPVEIPWEVAVARAQPRQSAGPVRVRRILVSEPVQVQGIPCMPVPQAPGLAVPSLNHIDAVAVIDSARRQRLLSDAELQWARSTTVGRRGARLSWSWWVESDARAESPAESWARVSCADAGFPPDAVQLWAWAGDRWYRLDLAWVLPGGGLLIVEIDGRDVHDRVDALFADRERQNRLVTTRTILRRYTGRDARTGVVATEVSVLLRRHGWSPRPVGDDVAYDVERAGFFLSRCR